MTLKLHLKFLSGNSSESIADSDELASHLATLLRVAKEITIKPLHSEASEVPPVKTVSSHILYRLMQPKRISGNIALSAKTDVKPELFDNQDARP